MKTQISNTAPSIHFSAPLWLYQGKMAWHFVTLPTHCAEAIRFHTHERKTAWGSVRVNVRVGHALWKTSLFPEAKSHSYVLPIKASVRQQENLQTGDTLEVTLLLE